MNEGAALIKLNKKYNLALQGIPGKAEDKIIRRDIDLAKETGAQLHIAHISTKTGCDYVSKAKRLGVKITAETCPHYFSLTDEDVLKFGVNAKMNPPLRTPEDREGIIEALKTGVIDCISTDHAPHSKEDKFDFGEETDFTNFSRTANGITGFETAFALGVTYLVKAGHITLERLIELMSKAPAKILGLGGRLGAIREGAPADFVIFNTEEKFVFDKNKSKSKSRNTPFHGFELFGRALYTVAGGRIEIN